MEVYGLEAARRHLFHPPSSVCSRFITLRAPLLSRPQLSSFLSLPASESSDHFEGRVAASALSPQKILDSRARASDSYLSGCLQSSWINAVGGEMSVRHWPTICSPSLSIFPCQEIICVAEHMNRIPMAISWENHEY